MSITPPLERDGYYHPASEAEISNLINFARRNGRKIRVRGSLHSPRASIHALDHISDLNVKLDRLKAIRIDSSNNLVNVEAGCHLGIDPMDATATWESSLLYELDRSHLSLPDFGGITHQTVSGFLSTGSSGSTIWHSNYDSIERIKVIDGMGCSREFSKNDLDESFFHASVVSAGLMGITTELTLRAIPRYRVRGIEHVRQYEDCEFDFFGRGTGSKPSLEQYFRDNEFVRLLWWPLANPPRIVTWKAWTMQDGDYDTETGPPDAFCPRPYNAFGSAPAISQRFVSALQRIVTRRWPPGPRRADRLNRWFPTIIDQFVPLDREVRFWDESWKTLPMDNQLDERRIPLEFTEMKIPIARTSEVLSKLRAHYEQYKILAAGTFGLEIYPCKSSNFWLSPAYGDDPFLKIDVIWFRNPTSDPVTSYFPQFWDLLKEFDFRLHWGKYLPAPSRMWNEYFRRQYPKWSEWNEIRNQMDPERVFVTKYWQDHLGI